MSGRDLLIVAGGRREHASTRHRLRNYLPFLDADGLTYSFLEYRGAGLPSAVARTAGRLRLLAELALPARAHRVVLIQKLLLPAALVRRWRRAGIRVVFDFDDALFAPWPGDRPARAERRRRRFDVMLGAVDAVIAGSPPLARYAAGRASTVTTIYPSLERTRFRALPRPGAEGVVVGWVGAGASQRYLRAIEPALELVLGRHPEVRLLVCSARPPEFGPLLRERMRFLPWSEENEVAAVGAFDVAVSPMGEDPWSQARGGRVSVLLSMAAGVPVVAAPGGGLDELIVNGESGVIARTEAEWREGLERLVKDPAERSRIGAAARAVVERELWADVLYPKWKAAVFGERVRGLEG
ncbi:MAG: glycosyltransferase family 4 protein [Gemmatimonadetes bacterium]|nr:glycosyltransferase family 4 protein [Gemmatimonadota bacterium]